MFIRKKVIKEGFWSESQYLHCLHGKRQSPTLPKCLFSDFCKLMRAKVLFVGIFSGFVVNKYVIKCSFQKYLLLISLIFENIYVQILLFIQVHNFVDNFLQKHVKINKKNNHNSGSYYAIWIIFFS